MRFLRTTYFFICLLLISTSVSFAQTTDLSESRMHLGVTAGVQLNNVLTESSIENGNRAGIALGIVGIRDISDFFAVRVELLYSTKGARNNYANNEFSGNVNFGLRYVEIPVMAQLTFADRVNIQAGLYGAYRLSTSIVSTGGIGQLTLGNADISAFDIGVSAGAEIQFDAFHFGLRYVGGFINVTGSQRSRLFLEDGSNNSFRLYAVYMLSDLFN